MATYLFSLQVNIDKIMFCFVLFFSFPNIRIYSGPQEDVGNIYGATNLDQGSPYFSSKGQNILDFAEKKIVSAVTRLVLQ